MSGCLVNVSTQSLLASTQDETSSTSEINGLLITLISVYIFLYVTLILFILSLIRFYMVIKWLI